MRTAFGFSENGFSENGECDATKNRTDEAPTYEGKQGADAARFADELEAEAAKPVNLATVTQIAVINAAGDGSGQYTKRQYDLANAYIVRAASEANIARLNVRKLQGAFAAIARLEKPLVSYLERRARVLSATVDELNRITAAYTKRVEAERAEAERHTPAALEARISELEAQLSALETPRAAKGKAGKE